MTFENKAFKWLKEGVNPPETLQEEGFKVGTRLPSEYLNQQWHATYKAIEELQEKSAEKEYVTTELNKKANVSDMTTALAKKVNAVEGKGLSTNDYTQVEKDKLASLQNVDVTGLATKDELKVHNTTATHNTWVTCATTSADTAKIGVASGFALATGSTVRVKFTNDNTASSATLNVNGTGAKALLKSDGTSFTKIVANGVYTFVYDGTSFIAQGEGGDYSVGDTIKYANLKALGASRPVNDWTFTGHSGGLQGVAVDADGNVYTASTDYTVKKINKVGTLIWTFTGHTSTVNGVAVDANGNVYTASGDKTIKKINKDGTLVWTFTGHTSNARGVAVDADGNVYTASNDYAVKKINKDGTLIWTFTGHTSFVNGVAVDTNGNVYTASDDKTIKKINKDGTLIWTFTGHTNIVRGIAVDTNGNVYTASNDYTVKKINKDGTLIWNFTGHTSTVNGVAVDTDGNVYTASGDGTAKKINKDGTLIWTFTGHTGNAYSVTVDADGNVYTASNDKTVKKIIEISDAYQIMGVD